MRLPLSSLFSRVLLTRRFLRAIERMALAQEHQVVLLTRIANQLAPEYTPIPEEDLRRTGPSFARDADLVRLQDLAEKFHRDTGRQITEDELMEAFEEQG